MTDNARQLDRRAFAVLIGVHPDTISRGVRVGTYPQPDGHIGDRPWWWESTIRAWQPPRNGRPPAAPAPHVSDS